MMKAMVCTQREGPNALQLQEVDRPTSQKKRQQHVDNLSFNRLPIRNQSKWGKFGVGDWLVIVNQVAIMMISIMWLIAGKLTWFVVGVVCLVLTFVPNLMFKDIAFRAPTKMCVSLLIGAHIVLGMHFGLYESSSIYDKLMHIIGSAAITTLVMAVTIQYCNRKQFRIPVEIFYALVLGVAISAGVFWEVFEFSLDRTGLFYTQRGLNDTMVDLIANAVGVFCVMVYVGRQRITPN